MSSARSSHSWKSICSADGMQYVTSPLRLFAYDTTPMASKQAVTIFAASPGLQPAEPSDVTICASTCQQYCRSNQTEITSKHYRQTDGEVTADIQVHEPLYLRGGLPCKCGGGSWPNARRCMAFTAVQAIAWAAILPLALRRPILRPAHGTRCPQIRYTSSILWGRCVQHGDVQSVQLP